MSTRVKSTHKLRMEIAAAAARMIATDGVTDYHAAKKKAALQLGLTATKILPSNLEVEQSLLAYQQLFQADTQASQLAELRQTAVKAMKLLQQFRPLLAGPVATGTATAATEITLHLFSSQVEQVGLYLLEQGIPCKLCEKQLRINATKHIVCPAYRFIAARTSILLVIFSEKDKNLNPVSSIDNKAMKLLNLRDLELLLNNDNTGLTN